MRLDAAVLNYCPGSTRAFVREAIAAGEITLNGKRAVKGAKLYGGETIAISELLEEKDNLPLPAGTAPEPIYEDEFLIAFDKPPGIAVQPLSSGETGTLMNRVITRYPECRTLGDRPLMAGAIHRIDADTSGLVLVARSESSFDSLRRQFADQSVVKTYLALVEGEVDSNGKIEGDLIHDPNSPACRMVDFDRWSARYRPSGKIRKFHAITEYVPLASTKVECETRTLLKVTIRTGVTHQIRAQLSQEGMHIINDRRYGAFAVEDQIGHALHSFAAEFNHPSDSRRMRITTPLPPWAQFISGKSFEL